MCMRVRVCVRVWACMRVGVCNLSVCAYARALVCVWVRVWECVCVCVRRMSVLPGAQTRRPTVGVRGGCAFRSPYAAPPWPY